jgi:hypothetical protein
MPTPRRYANQAERQAAYRNRLAAARTQELQARGMPLMPAIPSMPGSRRWEAMNQQALLLLQTVQEEMQDYYDERSDLWKESEPGETMAERLQMLQEAIAAVEGISP